MEFFFFRLDLMKLLIDSADTKAIEKLLDYYPIDGVTTNPSILAKSEKKPYEVLKEIRSLVGKKDLHVQVISLKAEDMVEEAKDIVSELGKDTFIKIPVTFEGVKAIKTLTEKGFNCTGTAVYTLQQAYMACHAGARWIAPYVNRIETTYGDGIGAVQEMQDLIDNNGYKTQILGASFHRIEQITGLAKYGVAAATVAPDLLMALLDNDNVTKAVEKFTLDFESLCGKGCTMRID